MSSGSRATYDITICRIYEKDIIMPAIETIYSNNIERVCHVSVPMNLEPWNKVVGYLLYPRAIRNSELVTKNDLEPWIKIELNTK